MRKLGIVLGIVFGVVALSGVIWFASDGDDGGRRLAALEQVEPLADGVTGTFRWRGGFDCEAKYEPLDVVLAEGSSYVAREAVADCVAPPERPWDLLASAGENGSPGAQGAQGQQGVPGTFNGTYTSPDGRFKLSVTNAGISLVGPDASVQVAPTEVEVSAAAKVSVKSGGILTVSGAAPVAITGPVLSLGGTSCTPVARQTDPVVGQVHAPGTFHAQIAQASTRVHAC